MKTEGKENSFALDDNSHQRADRQECDAFVDEVFNAAGLPLAHIPVRRVYRTQDIIEQIAPYLDDSVPVAAEVCKDQILLSFPPPSFSTESFWGSLPSTQLAFLASVSMMML